MFMFSEPAAVLSFPTLLAGLEAQVHHACIVRGAERSKPRSCEREQRNAQPESAQSCTSLAVRSVPTSSVTLVRPCSRR